MNFTRFFLAGVVAFLGGLLLQAQTPADLNEGSRFEAGATEGSFQFSWFGRPGVVYFIQSSEDLMNWKFFRLIEPGNGVVAAWGFGTTADRLFLRLAHTEVDSVDPWKEDFDGDGIANYDELLLGLHPFETVTALNPAVDDDGDGIVNGEDALPDDPAVGQLAVTILFPVSGGSVQ